MLDQAALNAHNAALRAAGLSPTPANAPLAGQSGPHSRPPRTPSLAALTVSSDPRLAAAAKRRLEEQANLPPVADPSYLELPEETAPVTEQSVAQRAANAGTMATGLPEDYVYGE